MARFGILLLALLLGGGTLLFMYEVIGGPQGAQQYSLSSDLCNTGVGSVAGAVSGTVARDCEQARYYNYAIQAAPILYLVAGLLFIIGLVLPGGGRKSTTTVTTVTSDESETEEEEESEEEDEEEGDEEPIVKKTTSGKPSFCPSCGTKLKKITAFCQYCGSELNEISTEEVEEDDAGDIRAKVDIEEKTEDGTELDEDIKYCVKCGKELAVEDRFCTKCGYDQEED